MGAPNLFSRNLIILIGFLLLVESYSAYIILHDRATRPSAVSTDTLPVATPTIDLPTPTSTPKPTPTLTPTPTSTPVPTPTNTPTPTSTPRPTPTPTPTPPPVSGPPKDGYSSIWLATERGNFIVKVISVNLKEARMITDAAADGDCAANCPTKSLGEYAQANNAFAGINGTYFCPPDYAECANKINSFDFAFYNSRTHVWMNPQNVYWYDRAIIYQIDSGLRFYSTESKGWPYVYHRKNEVKSGITNAPGLLENGTVIVDLYPLSAKQKTKSIKVGIGFHDAIVYLVVAYNVDMTDFAYVFKALGATNALNLDAGGSTALWYGGYKVGPGRKLPNAILFAK